MKELKSLTAGAGRPGFARWAGAVLGGALLLALPAAPASAEDGLLNRLCAGCHEADANGGLSRIKGQRKTPEGWLMTIVRMRLFHGLDITGDEQRQLVRELSETNGLAPSETADFRYILERNPSTVEALDQQMGEMCARCHSGARVALQRRTAEEWSLHVDFHVGQWPTIEYQALGRDREWFKIAKTEVAPKLAEAYPFETDAWTAWKMAPRADVRGDWVFTTRLPGVGETYGRMTVSGDAEPYTVIGSVVGANGNWTPMQGKVSVYTGYEWRAAVTIAGEKFSQVLMLGDKGGSLTGRQFLTDEDPLGGSFQAAKVGAGSRVLGIVPSAVRSGGTATVQVVGADLANPTVTGPVQPAGIGFNNFGFALNLQSAPGANAKVAVSGAGWTTDLAVYGKADVIKVEPGYTIARVGGGGGRTPPVKAMFMAVGYWAGPDGQPGTPDDIRIGEVPANWAVEPFDATAEELKDVKYAGTMDAVSGIFTPGPAGPNPERPFSTNNAGNLKIVADSGGMRGEGQLIVTVQRWNDPPIR